MWGTASMEIRNKRSSLKLRYEMVPSLFFKILWKLMTWLIKDVHHNNWIALCPLLWKQDWKDILTNNDVFPRNWTLRFSLRECQRCSLFYGQTATFGQGEYRQEIQEGLDAKERSTTGVYQKIWKSFLHFFQAKSTNIYQWNDRKLLQSLEILLYTKCNSIQQFSLLKRSKSQLRKGTTPTRSWQFRCRATDRASTSWTTRRPISTGTICFIILAASQLLDHRGIFRPLPTLMIILIPDNLSR